MPKIQHYRGNPLRKLYFCFSTNTIRMHVFNSISRVLALFSLSFLAYGQYQPQGWTQEKEEKALEWVETTYNNLSQDEKLGQLFIVALYTNKGESEIQKVKAIVEKEKIGGLILMQDDAKREVELLNELQPKAKVPLLIGMDAEWGLYQRIEKAYKLPWALSLGAIQDKSLVYEMSSQIAKDARRMGIQWVFAPVVDVNTNPNNPIIGNRSFGSTVENVVNSARAYTKGLQDHNVLAAIKHFPGHGDTDTDSHLDLPVVSHSIERLEKIELAPYYKMLEDGVGGVMVAHLYVPSLEKKSGVPASVSSEIVEGLLKKKMGYKGLIITDALNMGAVAKRYQPGALDLQAFKAGNDIMLFSQGVKEGKKQIAEAIEKGEIPRERLEESVKKILLTKYYLGLDRFEKIPLDNLDRDLNNSEHQELSQKLYAHSLTLLKNKDAFLPLSKNETYYYLPLEEASSKVMTEILGKESQVKLVSAKTLGQIPSGAKVLIGLHKDNSTAYKPFKISSSSRAIIEKLKQKHKVGVVLFGSPYGLGPLNLKGISSVLVAYENHPDAMKASADGLLGESPITGRLPVEVNKELQAGSGMDLPVTQLEAKLSTP